MAIEDLKEEPQHILRAAILVGLAEVWSGDSVRPLRGESEPTIEDTQFGFNSGRRAPAKEADSVWCERREIRGGWMRLFQRLNPQKYDCRGT